MSNSIRYYLAGYNFTAFVFWLLYLCSFALSSLKFSETTLVLLNLAQGMAVLEILHTILKWVKSPVGSTTAQVFSRILVLVVIDVCIMQGNDVRLFRLGLLIVSFAWGITELVRYSFYLWQLLDKQPRGLLWMRYTFFIVLYPLGVTGEWFILLAPIIAAGFKFSPYMAFMIAVAISYIYYFPVLYKYMWKQRKTRLV